MLPYSARPTLVELDYDEESEAIVLSHVDGRDMEGTWNTGIVWKWRGRSGWCEHTCMAMTLGGTKDLWIE